MRLYHLYKIVLLVCALMLIGTGCSTISQPPVQEDIQIQIDVDGRIESLQIPAGSSVGETCNCGRNNPGGKRPRLNQRLSITLTEDTEIHVIRVEESIETEQVVIPFEVIRQPTENLPAGQEKLLQAGKNGLKEIVSVRVFENGEETSFSEVSSLDLEETVNEIILVGVQSSIAPISLPSPLVYLSNGNAWVMDQSTSNRYLLVATGDLDGTGIFTFRGWRMAPVYPDGGR